MEFRIKIITQLMAISFLSGAFALNAEGSTGLGFAQWAKSLLSTVHADAAAVIKPVVTSVGAKQAVSEVPKWIEKCNINLNPIKGIVSLGKAGYTNPGWACSALIGTAFAGYYVRERFVTWWDCQVEIRKHIMRLIEIDKHPSTQNNKEPVEAYAKRYQSWPFVNDKKLLVLIDSFYNYRIKTKFSSLAELQRRGDAVINYLLGKICTC